MSHFTCGICYRGVGPVLELMGSGFPCRLTYDSLWARYHTFLSEKLLARVRDTHQITNPWHPNTLAIHTHHTFSLDTPASARRLSALKYLVYIPDESERFCWAHNGISKRPYRSVSTWCVPRVLPVRSSTGKNTLSCPTLNTHICPAYICYNLHRKWKGWWRVWKQTKNLNYLLNKFSGFLSSLDWVEFCGLSSLFWEFARMCGVSVFARLLVKQHRHTGMFIFLGDK